MKLPVLVIATVASVAAASCCLYVHRRAIKAAFKGEPMPKAPSWHVWVKEENRRPSEEESAAAAEELAAEMVAGA